MKALATLFLSCILIAGISCKKSKKPAGCDQSVVISDSVCRGITTTTTYAILDVKIEGDCMALTFAAAGCDGKSWVTDLVDAGLVADSNPPQRYLKLSLANNEGCKAMINKTIRIDLTPIRVKGNKSVRLNLTGFAPTLIYHY